MGQAEQLAQAATELNKASTTYTNAVGQIERASGFVSGLAAGLLNGKTAWSGNGSSAFETAWNKSYGDAKNVNTALGGTATSMSTLATTITDNLGPIQTYDALAQVDVNSIPQEGLAGFRQDLLSAQQDANTSLNTISTKAQSLAMTLSGDLSTSVGVCSSGTVAVPLSPTMKETNNYWTGFLSGALAQEMADANENAAAGANAGATTTAGDATCPAPIDPKKTPPPKLTAQQLQRQYGVVLVIGALIAAGGSAGGSAITGGTEKQDIDTAIIAFLAYLVSPSMKNPINKFLNVLDKKCGWQLSDASKGVLVSDAGSGIRNSILTGLVGGRGIIPFIDLLLHPIKPAKAPIQKKSAPVPTPPELPYNVTTPTPVAVPTPFQP